MFWYVTRTSYNGLGGYNYDMHVRRKMSKGISDFLSSIDKMTEIHQGQRDGTQISFEFKITEVLQYIMNKKLKKIKYS